MAVHKVIVVFAVVLFTSIGVHKVISESTEPTLDSIQNAIAQIQSNITENQRHHRIILDLLLNLTAKNDEALFMIGSVLHDQNIFTSCTIYPSYPSGKYVIQPSKLDIPFAAYCDQTVFGGGWLVFQHRYNGAVDFYRQWNDYVHGFGDLDGEFWLGLEILHRLTTARPHELLVELMDFEGEYSYAFYDKFQIGSEKEKFMVKELGQYRGTADDALRYAKGKKFSTKDQDNDTWEKGDCAWSYKGAWWYGYCADSNLNGLRANKNDPQSMYWSTSYYKPHSSSRMMIRQT